MAMSVYRTNILILLAAVAVISGCVDVEAPTDSGSRSDGVIFVAARGSDQFPGTREWPMRTLRGAMLLAAEGGAASIRIAAGTYHGGFALVGGVDILGGLDPETWASQTGEYSEIVLSRTPITGQGVHLEATIRSLAIRAETSRDSQRMSTHALYLTDCGDNLRFEDCRFTSDAGKAGEAGGDGNEGWSLRPDHDGLPGGTGACADTVAAAGGESLYWADRGAGGDGGPPGQPGQTGIRYAEYDGSALALGGAGGDIGQPGGDGETGTPGVDGTNGQTADRWGLFFQFEFQPSVAEKGDGGGQGFGGGGGGGGGGSNEGTGNGGGSGGRGGNTGNPGRGGQGGGYSLAVVCLSSPVIFSDCHFISGQGGNGGNGGHGGLGSAGSIGGIGGSTCSDQVGTGGNGGDGGRGGHGGGGGGGHAGWSYSLYIDGTGAPLLEGECLFTHGDPGDPGFGGLVGGVGIRAPDGQPGQSGDIWTGAFPAP